MTSSSIITNLTGKIIIATHALDGSFFDKSIVYICENDEHGSMGLALNIPVLGVKFVDVLNSMGVPKPIDGVIGPKILNGGPVYENRGFVLHSDDYQHESTEMLAEGIYLSTSGDIVNDIAQGYGPCVMSFCLGYSGWNSGQLESEIASGDWHVIDASPELIFNTPTEEKYPTSLSLAHLDGAGVVGTIGLA